MKTNTTMGIIAGVVAAVSGVTAGMLLKNSMTQNAKDSSPACVVRQKASNAMHTVSDAIDRAADDIID